MKTRYIDLIDQTFYFPTEEFKLKGEELLFHGIDLMEIVEKYGTPLKFTYLPKISDNIQRVKNWFQEAMIKLNYQGKYEYCYCTKSSHFSFVVDQVLKNNVSLETSSAYDIDIIEHLNKEGKFSKEKFIICNGYKTDDYLEKIAKLIDAGYENCVPVIDNYKELDKILEHTQKRFSVGIRIASEEEPKFNFYTSRLGIRYKNIVPYYKEVLQNKSNVDVKMLHFFINTGITDTAYYWNELTKCLRVYCELKQVCPELDSLNIGGGFPIKNSLAFEFDYYYMIEEIITQVRAVCSEYNIEEPNIFTEFGSYTVGESGGAIFKVLGQKQQNDREKWNMIDSSFMTNLPDTWSINQRFIMLPINRWADKYERVLLGGLTCDSDDYYNSEQHTNAIYLPKYSDEEPLYIGFFNTGAYQDTVGGFGGLQHCLIPNPRMILIDKDENGKYHTEVFADKQSPESFMKLLGY
ncbi:MAG: arginine decarboxylase [Crocinitomicaceae bacterium]|nr:arginine decarboxylase [Crocinitomicaceae bacterium]